MLRSETKRGTKNRVSAMVCCFGSAEASAPEGIPQKCKKVEDGCCWWTQRRKQGGLCGEDYAYFKLSQSPPNAFV